MNTLLRRFFILAAVLLCCTAMANAYDAQIDGIYYNFDKANGTATVTAGGSKYEGDITIPAKVTYESKEYIVTSIGASAFYKNYALTSITIPSGVTSIGDNSFAECSNLASVTFAEGSKLESIGAAAFYNCWANLISIVIPNSVKAIGDRAFAECNALASVTFAEGSKLESIGASAFYWCNNLASITIPSAVTSIGASAFYRNYALTSITIPSGVTSMGASAFYMCRNLESITIPSGVTSIGDSTFYNCSKLASVTFAEGSKLESIGAGAFADSYALASITIPSSVTSIGASAFYRCRNLESITIPSGVTSIGDNSFAECSNLASVTFAEGSKLESIGAAAFYNCWANLTSIVIPNSVKTIGDRAFAECNALASVTFEEGSKLESIGAGAFANSYALESITIPSSVTSIGASAFYKNYALASITIPSSVTSIGASAFYWCSNLASITIPSAVTSIGDNAFAECDKLASVTFEEGSKLESIGAAAFYKNYALTSITIPSGVTSIGDNAFAECDKLATVTFAEGSKLESIGAAAFYNCWANLTSIVIPNSVKTIGDRAFAECDKLAEITVNWVYPKDIPEISSSVFTGVEKSKCILYAPLLGVYDKKEEWKDFTIHAENNIAVKKNDGTIKLQLANNDNVIEVNEKDMTLFLASQDVSNVKSITYTRDFTNVAGKWQAWFVPFEAPVSVLNEASIDAAEVAGILLDDEGETIVAFKKIEGDSKKMHANTPYVVRMGNDATTIATLVFENTNLKETAESEYYAMSMYDKFTFTGNYESKHVADSYTLNKDGEFQQMNENVNLKPMRFSLSITPRDDSPYISQSNPKAVIRYMVLGDDGTLQPIDEDGRTGIKPATTPAHSFKRSQQPMRIYDLHGRKVNRIQSKQVYIIDGKTYTAR